MLEVRRRIEVPISLRLDCLHLTIQAAMGWTNTHLFEIRARDVGWGIADPDWPDGPHTRHNTQIRGHRQMDSHRPRPQRIFDHLENAAVSGVFRPLG